MTKIMLLQQEFCHGKHTFVATKDLLCHDKHVCHNKHMFVMTTLLSWQKHLRQLPPMTKFTLSQQNVGKFLGSCPDPSRPVGQKPFLGDYGTESAGDFQRTQADTPHRCWPSGPFPRTRWGWPVAVAAGLATGHTPGPECPPWTGSGWPASQTLASTTSPSATARRPDLPPPRSGTLRATCSLFEVAATDTEWWWQQGIYRALSADSKCFNNKSGVLEGPFSNEP